MVKKIVKRKRRVLAQGPKLRSFKVGFGLPTPTEILAEIEDMRDVLLGREESPVGGYLALMEVADAYFSRLCEIEQIIFTKQRDGEITKGGAYDEIRRQELRSMKEVAKGASDLGSRRLTAETLNFERSRVGRESR